MKKDVYKRQVEKCVRKLEGVEEVSVNLLTNSMHVQYLSLIHI